MTVPGDRIRRGHAVTIGNAVRVGAPVRIATPSAGKPASVLLPSESEGSGGDREFAVHTQTAPDRTWVIDHELGFRPGGISVEDGDGSQVHWSDRDDPTPNRTVLTFLVPVSGRAYLS